MKNWYAQILRKLSRSRIREKIVQLTWKFRQIKVSFQFSKQNENCRYVNKENIDFVIEVCFLCYMYTFINWCMNIAYSCKSRYIFNVFLKDIVTCRKIKLFLHFAKINLLSSLVFTFFFWKSSKTVCYAYKQSTGM